MSASGRVGFLCVVPALSLALTGCAMTVSSEGSGAAVAGLTVSGRVHGGQQPISGASVQLYAANMGAIKGASTPLLTTPAVTDKDGGFSFAFSCTDASFLYVVATGGNPGLTGAVDNQQIALMSLVGSCGMLAGATSLSVDELTTVASVEALAPFMAGYQDVGADPGNTAGLMGAYAGAEGMVDFETGELQATTAGVTIPGPLLYTLADILAACVNTACGTAGDGSACGTLLADAGSGGATETIGAMVRIVGSPAANVSALYGLVSTQSPFVPALAVTPTDLTFSLAVALASLDAGTGQYLLTISSDQHVWVYPEQAVDGQDIAGSITVYDTLGNISFSIPPGSGGLDRPLQLIADPFGNVWALNSSLTLSKFSASGVPISKGSGYQVKLLPPPLSTGTNYFGVNVFSADPSGNLWGINSGTTTDCFIEVNNDGETITPAGNFCNAAGNTVTPLVATDGSGNAWYSGDQTLSKVSSSGTFLTSGVNSNGCFYESYDDLPIGTVAELLAYNYLAESITVQLHYDRTKDQLWGVTLDGVGALHSDGSQAFCHPRAKDLPVVPFYDTEMDGLPDATSGEVYISASSLDGGGNLWFSTGGFSLVQDGSTVTTSSLGGLNAVNSSGELVTPYDAIKGIYGLQLARNTVSGAMEVDGYGNIWTIESISSPPGSKPVFSLVKVTGLAVPKSYQ